MSRSFLLAVALVPPAVACSLAPAPRAPSSFVLVTIDTLRADHVTARLTPALERLASEAIVFENAVTVAPLTLPAHASLFTALYPPRHGVRDNHLFSLSQDVPVFPELLKRRGYATAAFVSAVVLDRRYGLARGFDVYDAEMGGPERPASETLARTGAWLEHAPRPFFLWVHLFEPHTPYRSGSYAGEVQEADGALGELFALLRARGIWDEVIVTVTSDHGESLGEHGEQTHGFFVYEAAIRIPWVLRVPGHGPQKIEYQARLVDIMPTMLELAKVDTRELSADRVDGVSLAPFLRGNGRPGLEAYAETFLPRYQFGWGDLKTFRGERFKYIQAPTPELYDLRADPAETRNLASEAKDTAERLRRQLAVLERRQARVSARQSDSVLAERLMSLGYIGYSPAVAEAPGAALPDPKDKLEVYSLTMAALELSESGQKAAALEKLRRAERLDAQVAQVYYLKGLILGDEGKFREAAQALERAVTLSPRHVAARFKLALAYLRLGRHDRAEQMLETVLQDEPQNVRAYHNLAAVAYARGDLRRAEEVERRALSIDASYFEAWNTLGAIYVVTKQPDAAIDALRRATSLNPQSAQAFYNLALAFGAAGRRQEAAAARATACALDERYCRR